MYIAFCFFQREFVQLQMGKQKGEWTKNIEFLSIIEELSLMCNSLFGEVGRAGAEDEMQGFFLWKENKAASQEMMISGH